MAAIYVEEVERALDRYCTNMRHRHGVEPEGFRTKTLAVIAGVDRDTMGRWLQDYRRAQGKNDALRYAIAAHKYGTTARWRLLRKPGVDTNKNADDRRVHTMWVAEDMAARFTSDVIHEVEASLRKKASDDLIRGLVPLVQDQLLSVVRHVHRVLDR